MSELTFNQLSGGQKIERSFHDISNEFSAQFRNAVDKFRKGGRKALNNYSSRIGNGAAGESESLSIFNGVISETDEIKKSSLINTAIQKLVPRDSLKKIGNVGHTLIRGLDELQRLNSWEDAQILIANVGTELGLTAQEIANFTQEPLTLISLISGGDGYDLDNRAIPNSNRPMAPSMGGGDSGGGRGPGFREKLKDTLRTTWKTVFNRGRVYLIGAGGLILCAVSFYAVSRISEVPLVGPAARSVAEGLIDLTSGANNPDSKEQSALDNNQQHVGAYVDYWRRVLNGDVSPEQIDADINEALKHLDTDKRTVLIVALRHELELKNITRVDQAEQILKNKFKGATSDQLKILAQLAQVALDGKDGREVDILYGPGPTATPQIIKPAEKPQITPVPPSPNSSDYRKRNTDDWAARKAQIKSKGRRI